MSLSMPISPTHRRKNATPQTTSKRRPMARPPRTIQNPYAALFNHYHYRYITDKEWLPSYLNDILTGACSLSTSLTQRTPLSFTRLTSILRHLTEITSQSVSTHLERITLSPVHERTAQLYVAASAVVLNALGTYFDERPPLCPFVPIRPHRIRKRAGLGNYLAWRPRTFPKIRAVPQ